MKKILRASKAFPGDHTTVPYRVVLVKQEGQHCNLVVWYQMLPTPNQPRWHFSTGDYFRDDQLTEAHERFEERMAAHRLTEDISPDMGVLNWGYEEGSRHTLRNNA